jgi:N-glycosylase/DNA lyase
LLTQEGLDKPAGLEEVKKSFKNKYGDLLANEAMTLGAKTSLSTERLRNTLRRYSSTLETSRSRRKREKDKQRRSFQLNYFLSTLFSPKQKELVLKKLNGEPLNKTEREYFSRTVKKKLEALNNSEVRKVAKALAA